MCLSDHPDSVRYCVSEPLGGVVEGLSAGMFLIGMMVAVVSLLVYRQRLRKVWVQENTLTFTLHTQPHTSVLKLI